MGMTCASCAKAVERAVSRLPGTIEVSVNYAAERAKVVYEPGKTRLSEIRHAIEKAGYKPLEADTGEKTDCEKDLREKEREIVMDKVPFFRSVYDTPFLYCDGSHDTFACTRIFESRYSSAEFQPDSACSCYTCNGCRL